MIVPEKPKKEASRGTTVLSAVGFDDFVAVLFLSLEDKKEKEQEESGRVANSNCPRSSRWESGAQNSAHAALWGDFGDCLEGGTSIGSPRNPQIWLWRRPR